MPSQIVSAPAEEPVSLEEARGFCRVDSDFYDDDALISSLIVAARQDAEKITWRALVTQSWRMVVDRFPSPQRGFGNVGWYGPDWGTVPGPILMASPEGRTGFEFFLPKPPLVSVTSITYVDTNGATQTLASDQYLVDSVSEPGRVTPAYGTLWPATRDQINAVTVSFTCGYGSAAAVPEGIKRWIRMRVSTLYENREEVAILGRGKVEILPFVDGLLDDYRVKSF